MKFPAIFKNSAKELKSPRCLATTGILIALYVGLEMIPALDFGHLKINFAFLALAIIGMLFGPVPAMLAAIPCDIIPVMLRGYAVIPVFTLIAVLEAVIYALFLYKRDFSGFTLKKEARRLRQCLPLVLSRSVVIIAVNMCLNTIAAYYTITLAGGVPLSETRTLFAYFVTKISANIIKLPADIVLMLIVVPAAWLAYRKVHGGERTNT